MRRLRGIVGMGISWAVPWGVVIGITGGLLISLLPAFPPGVSRLAVALQAALLNGFTGAVMGFATGSVFSLVLMAAERKRDLPNLKSTRFALWGGLAGAVSSLAIVLPALAQGQAGLIGAAVVVGVTVGLGVGSATASLAIARSDLTLDPATGTEGQHALPRN
ncbi:hypothetical protein ACFL0I_00160 [Gemmatimonadota bacterium]